MIPRASYSAPLDRFLRRRRWLLRVEALTAIMLMIFAVVLVAILGHAALTTLLNLTFPGIPPGCC